MVLVKPNDIAVRKLIFYLVTIGQIVGTIALIIVFIVLMATSGWIDDACEKSSYADCTDNAKKWVIIAFVCSLCIDLLMCFCVLQILYYGWKEQEALAAERIAHGDGGQGAQVYQQVPAGGQYYGHGGNQMA